MKVKEPQFTVAKSKQPLAYQSGSGANMSAVAQGLGALGSGVSQLSANLLRAEEEQKAKDDQMKRFKSLTAMTDFATQVELEQNEFRKTAAPDDTQFATKAVDLYLDREAQFIRTLDPELQEEFKMRVGDIRAKVTIGSYEYQDKQLTDYYMNEVNKRAELAAGKLAEDPELVETWRSDLKGLIASSDMSETNKVALATKIDEYIETAAYRSKVRKGRLIDAQYADDLVTATQQAAGEFNIPPEWILTAISYETGGKFSTATRGGARNRHVGLIQFGLEEQKKYGVKPGQPVSEQMAAVVAYLKDRGFKPGMSFAQLYATINGGNPGALGASDEKNGGMPGTVLDKVNSPEMAQHRAKAVQMLDGKYIIPDDVDSDPRFSNVPYEARMAARADTNTEINQMMAQLKEERKKQHDTYMNTVKVGAYDGSFGRLDLDREIAAGRLNDYEDRKIVTEIIEKREKDISEGQTFWRKIGTGTILNYADEADKKGMNHLFGKEGMDALNARDPNYVTNSLVPTFAKYSMIAPDARNILGSLIRSNDPREIFFAAAALTDLEEQNPVAYAAQIPEQTRKIADRWELLKETMTEEELAKAMLGPRTTEERRQYDILREAANKEITGPNAKVTFETVEDAFGGIRIPGAKGQIMEREWMALLEENYAAMGGVSLEDANKVTIKQLKNRWGVSTFDGRQTLMKRPPEKYLPAIAGSHQYLTDQVRGETGVSDDTEIYLIPDLRTENEIAAGIMPTYNVYTNQDGAFLPLIVDGAPYRHQFEITKVDDEVNKLHLRVENKKAELAYYTNMINSNNMLIKDIGDLLGFDWNSPGLPIPDDVRESAKRVQEELAVLQGQLEPQKEQAKIQYETPAYKQLKAAYDKYKQLNDIYVGDPDEDPDRAEIDALAAEIERLKAVVAEERKNRSQN